MHSEPVDKGGKALRFSFPPGVYDFSFFQFKRKTFFYFLKGKKVVAPSREAFS
jgi:hypothetical protein